MSNYDEFRNRLEGNLSVFRHLLSELSEEEAVWKPGRDRWSVLETLCHLIDIEVEDFRTDLKIVLFHPEEKWPSFDELGWVTERRYNEQDFAEKIVLFTEEREKSLRWLARLENPDLELRHKGEGGGELKLRAGDVLASWVGHDLYHIRQLALLRYDLMNRDEYKFSPQYSGFES